MYKNYLSWTIRPIEDNLFKFFISAEGQEELKKLASAPKEYLKKHQYPFFANRKKAIWTTWEDKMLIDLSVIVEDASIFSFISLIFPGRSGAQVYARYSQLLKDGIIKRDIRKIEAQNKKVQPYRRYFSPNHEKLLASELIVKFNEGIHLSPAVIKKEAKDFYMTPWVLAERAAFQLFYKEKLPIYTDETFTKYTEAFIDASQILVGELQPFGPFGQVSEKSKYLFISKYKLPIPVFSDTWVRAFMKRNRFSWRRFHYSRRGSIDPIYKESFLNQLAEAFVKYGPRLVLNMDETSVRINNGRIKTIAPVALEKIIFEGKMNEKECFTSIGTCSSKRTFPMIMLGKGKTAACCAKFRAPYGSFEWESKNGLVDENVMIRYLKWVTLNITFGEPCSLVLDCYRAHRTEKVKEEAKKLDIELIYVPANGTSIFQPLDRRIFGVLKSRLRLLSGSQIFTGPNRFEMIANHLIKAWNKTSLKALKSAWNIPTLSERIAVVRSKNGNSQKEDSDSDEEEIAEKKDKYKEANNEDLIDDDEEECNENIEENEEEEEEEEMNDIEYENDF